MVTAMTDQSSLRIFLAGASRGIGAAAARVFAEEGARITLVSRSRDACQDLAADLDASGTRALAAACDVSDYAQVVRAVDGAVTAFGGIDVVVNNAGVIEPISRLADADPEAWGRSIAVNLIGAWHVVRATLPHLCQSAGALINVSSGAAGRPLEGWSAYCAGKAGLAMLTRAVDLEYGDQGVRVFGFRPGVVDTEMQVQIRASGVNPVSQLRRSDLLPPEEPARFMAWLTTPSAADLTGREVDIRDPTLRKRAGLLPV